jgi:hypothetical protein
MAATTSVTAGPLGRPGSAGAGIVKVDREEETR